MAEADPSQKSEDIEMKILYSKSQDGPRENQHDGEKSSNQVSASEENGSHEQSKNKRKCCIKRWEEIHKERTDRDKEEAKEKMNKRKEFIRKSKVQYKLDVSINCENGNRNPIKSHAEATESGDYYMFIDETERKQIMGSDDENMKMHKPLQLVGFDLEKEGVSCDEEEKEEKSCKELMKQCCASDRSFCDCRSGLNKLSLDYRNLIQRLDWEKKNNRKSNAADEKEWKITNENDKKLSGFWVIWYAMAAHFYFVCYFIFILNMMLNPSVLSGILPFIFFFCACFRNIRYNTVLWVIAGGYTLISFISRFNYHFRSFSWNSQQEVNLHQNEPFWLPRILGIEKSVPSLVMDSLQLVFVLLQIILLMCPGFPRCWCNGASEATGSQKATTTETTDNREATTTETTNNREAMTTIEKKSCICCCCCKETKWKKKDENIYDVYLLMLVCDIINFLIFAFAYWSFGFFSTHHTNLLTHLQSNHVPHGFLILLLVQFGLMFFDRIRYLLHCYYFGLVYHILLMVGVHVFLFWFVPYCDNRPFNQNCFAQIWYFFKAVYFFLSAYQIRCGYPSVLTTMYVFPQYGTLDWVLTKCYRIIPFLAEVKTLMDYVFTKTTLTRSEWFNFQSIYAEVYDLECSKSEKDSVRGAPQEWCGKFGWFIGLVFVLIIIFGPLFALYIGITVLGVTNNPMQVAMKISLGSFEPLFQVVADSDHIKVWTETEFENFRQDLSISKNAEEFVKDFGYRQIVTVTVGGESKRIWTISPPQYELLVDRLSPNSTKPVRLLFEWTLTNDPAVTDIVTSYGSNSVMLEQSSEERKHIYQLMKQTKRINTTDSAIIMNLFPQYVHSQSTSSTVRPAYNLYQGTGKTFTNVRLTLRRNDSSTWWRVFDDSTPKEKPNLQLTIFSDKVSHPHWDFIVSMGWTTLYLSGVLVVGGLIRQSCGSTSTIMFQELPNVKRILELCNDIYVAQENSMFKLEELLYAKLIFLYRSPTTLIKWTKPESLKENENELKNSSQDVVVAASTAAPSSNAPSNGFGCCCCC